MGIHSRELDRRVTLMRAAPVDDGLGTVDGEFQPLTERWAGKTDISDGERIRAAQNGQAVTARFLLRWDSVTATLSDKDRIVDRDARVYEVVNVKEVRGRRVGIEVTAVARS